MVRIISNTPGLRADAVKHAAAIVAEAAKPEQRELAMFLASKTQVYGVQVKAEEAWAETWKAYLEALADVPLAAVAVAFRRWDKGECYPDDLGRHSFYPGSAEIYRMALPYMQDLQVAAYRAKRFLEEGGGADEEPWTEERKRRYREEAIAMGALTPEGKFNIKLPTFKPPRPMSYAEVQRLRALADAPPTPTQTPDSGEEVF